jgi:CBS domain containing-hemolysin-like protein
MLPILCIYLGGILTLLIALFHTGFYKIFNWKADFGKLSPLNTRILYSVHIALLLLFFLTGILSLIYAKELARSNGLAAGLNFSLSLFWLWRFIWQIAYFKREQGQKIPFLSILLSAVFALLCISYSVPLIYRFLN